MVGTHFFPPRNKGRGKKRVWTWQPQGKRERMMLIVFRKERVVSHAFIY